MIRLLFPNRPHHCSSHRPARERGQARQALGKAGEIIQALAANIGDEGLRAGFLAAAVLGSQKVS